MGLVALPAQQPILPDHVLDKRDAAHQEHHDERQIGPDQPGEIPGEIAAPPAAVSCPALSAVMLRAVVAPSPMPHTRRLTRTRPGRGAGERRWPTSLRATVAAGPPGGAGLTFTRLRMRHNS